LKLESWLPDCNIGLNTQSWITSSDEFPSWQHCAIHNYGRVGIKYYQF
jgi:hypothetical protein